MTNSKSHYGIDAVLFDLDGTLLDTAPDLAAALNCLLDEQGLPALPFADIRCVVSEGARALIKLGFDLEPPHPDFAPLHQRLLEIYANHLAVATKPFPGVAELLHFLGQHAIPWGVVTNKPVRFTEPLMQAMDLKPGYATLVCPDHVTHSKPHPEPMLLACRQAGSEPHNTFYVGDHPRDIAAGHAAGMRTIAVRYGYLAATEDIDGWNADHVVADAVEIIAIISRLLILKQI